ncbi:hypothetical protein POTOM_003573 [Populus tomentosa]|uniref:Endonuclease/exonuclease/phosphatase domain-containing protein n=1 Tax=Populus tomentosa TaxID=118781 RepID=A0A8X8DEP3_POPTO|nr:hypothetical protein POTOM_003573 [Populus tomentosa]
MNWVQRKIYLYNVTFGLFMLDWWERCLFNILVIVLMWFIFYNGSRYVTDFCKRKGKALPVQVMAGVVILTKETAVEQHPYKALSASATKAAELKQQPKPDKGKGIDGAPVPSLPIPNDQAHTEPTTVLATLHNPSSSATHPAAHPVTQDTSKGIIGVPIPSVLDQPDPITTNPNLPLNTFPIPACPQPDPQSSHTSTLQTFAPTSTADPKEHHDTPRAEGYNSCQDADADNATILCIIANAAKHQVPMPIDNAPCQESKMDSLGTQSESTHVDIDTTADTSSTSNAVHNASPSSSLKTAKKKKGGRRRKEWLSCKVTVPSLTQPLKITFIYNHNTPAERTLLWKHLCHESSLNTGIPWLVMGDFNAILHTDDRIEGDMQWYRHQDDFRHYIRQSELIQIPYTGPRFTWHNGQHGSHTIQKKLDWIFSNQCLLSTWTGAYSTFHPRHISDHSPMIFNLLPVSCKRQVPFKFLNLWADRDDFMTTVTSS